jgi:flagellar biosynthetic protein FliP
MFIKFVVSVLFITLTPSILFAQDIGVLGLPALEASPSTDGGTQYSLSLQVLALMTAITVVPSIILGMTSFTRIIIVLSILRQALGTQQTPPNQVLIAIALFLSFFIMSPILISI